MVRESLVKEPVQGPKFGPRSEGFHSAEGSSQDPKGPHRDHGYVFV